jgi:hypothetical protein
MRRDGMFRGSRGRGRHLGLVLGGEAIPELVEALHLGGVDGGHGSWAEGSRRFRGVGFGMRNRGGKGAGTAEQGRGKLKSVFDHTQRSAAIRSDGSIRYLPRTRHEMDRPLAVALRLRHCLVHAFFRCQAWKLH